MRLFICDGVAFAMAVAADGVGAAAGLDDHVREHHSRLDLHRRDMRHVDRLLLPPDPARACTARRLSA